MNTSLEASDNSNNNSNTTTPATNNNNTNTNKNTYTTTNNNSNNQKRYRCQEFQLHAGKKVGLVVRQIIVFQRVFRDVKETAAGRTRDVPRAIAGGVADMRTHTWCATPSYTHA